MLNAPSRKKSRVKGRKRKIKREKIRYFVFSMIVFVFLILEDLQYLYTVYRLGLESVIMYKIRLGALLSKQYMCLLNL